MNFIAKREGFSWKFKAVVWCVSISTVAITFHIKFLLQSFHFMESTNLDSFETLKSRNNFEPHLRGHATKDRSLEYYLLA